jgi:hypothetical protein
VIRKSELIAALARIPGDPVITVWLPGAVRPMEGCDSDIEQIVVANDTREGGETVCLGLDIELDGETVWGGR